MQNYKLRKKIRENFWTEKEFAELIGMNNSSLSLRLNNKISWKIDEIIKIVKILNIPKEEIHIYFFEFEEAKQVWDFLFFFCKEQKREVKKDKEIQKEAKRS